MTKSDFIAAVAETANVPKAEAGRVIDAAANILTGIMRDGDSVNIPGLGIFTSKMRDAHPGKNPATGETITIPAKRTAVFRPAKQLKDALN